MDGQFGHALANRGSLSQGMAKAAAKMLMKYHRQLGDALMARIRGE